jgi:DnaD/phage-associated family protein
MADYWIKWYIEIIDDPKMATLPDRLWRRFSELCLLAGRLCPDKSGKLPDTRQLAWALRMPTDELQTDLVQLASTGILKSIPGGWLIPNFKKRQSAASSTERVHQHRARKQKQQYYEDETQLKRNVTQSRLTETETESETETNNSSSSDFAALTRVYETNIGQLSPAIADTLEDDLKAYGLQMCVEAITEAVRNNVRKWSYVQGILKRWYRDGKSPINGKQHKSEPVEIVIPGIGKVEART